MNYYRNIITDQSWNMLTNLSKEVDFILIGGWAVWIYTKKLKSKDIDIIVSFDQLEKLKLSFPLTKNDRLRKYEIIQGSVQIDIYVPFWSDLGFPVDIIHTYSHIRDGFTVPWAEILLITKQIAYQARGGSAKGRKDMVDIVSLSLLPEISWTKYHKMLGKTGKLREKLLTQFKSLISSEIDLPELSINRHQYAKIKKRILPEIAG